MMKNSERIAGFVDAIWQWFAVHKRSLPWRDLKIADDTQRAYMVLVSEVMLQQTQVPRVEVIFRRFLEQFPMLRDLAIASNRDVILAWRGMGYNSRALRLRDAAERIVDDYDGVFPSEMEELQSIPGLGHYTAAAIRNFAFELPTPCIDTNIRRILHRTFVGPENPDGTWKCDDRYLLNLAGEILKIALEMGNPSKPKTNKPINQQPRRGAAAWHAALMDFGSLVQTKRSPRWDICPLTKRGLMKATPKNFPKSCSPSPKSEPGREVAGKFIPNRIFRGRIVEELRNAHRGLPLGDIGKRICIDWSPRAHRRWLVGIIEKLQVEKLIIAQRGKFLLRD